VAGDVDAADALPASCSLWICSCTAVRDAAAPIVDGHRSPGCALMSATISAEVVHGWPSIATMLSPAGDLRRRGPIGITCPNTAGSGGVQN